jgi:CBS domain-containing protein
VRLADLFGPPPVVVPLPAARLVVKDGALRGFVTRADLVRRLLGSR